jgi:hypothetical protein
MKRFKLFGKAASQTVRPEYTQEYYKINCEPCLKCLKKIEFGHPTFIYYNGITKFFINREEVDPFEVVGWWAFGMKCTSKGSIMDFLIKNMPENVALVLRQADFHEELPEMFKKNFKHVFQVARYTGVSGSIVVPGDDDFFVNPQIYYPSVDIPFDERINKVFWRGSTTEKRRRDVVLELSDIPDCDVKISTCGMNRECPYWSKLPSSCLSERVHSEEYHKYKIWLSLEGWGCASDTSRALMSGCAVIYFRRTKPWFHSYLKHEENCIIVEDNIDDLKFYINKLLSNPEYTRKIASNGKQLSYEIFKKEVYEKFILDQL